MKLNWFKTTYFFLILVITLLIIQYGLQISAGGHSWKSGDWLINYSDGFIRRGLTGSFALFLAQKLSVNIKWIIFSIQATVFSLLSMLILLEFFKFKENPKSIFIILSPAFAFMFWMNDPSVAFRKEINIYLSLFFILKAFENINFKKSWYFFGFLSFLISGLSHEITIFFLPFFLFPIFNHASNNNYDLKTFTKYSLPFIASSLLILLLSIIFKGSSESSNLICSSLNSYNLSSDICDGAIKWLSYDTRFGFERVIELGASVWLNYIALALLSFLPIFLMRADSKFNALVLTGIVFMLPLFLIAVDYGRFISMIYTSSILVAIWTRPEIIKYGWRFTGLISVGYCFLWTLPNCCKNLPGKGLLGDGLLSIYSIFVH